MILSHDILSADNIGLAWSFHVSLNSCDNPMHYENFLRLCAMAERKEGRSVTHLLVDTNAGHIAGYASLRASSMISYDENGVPFAHPAIEVSELAVAEEYERRGIGGSLIDIALLVADELRKNSIGIMYLTVCADPAAVGFYESIGFEKLSDVYQLPRDGWNVGCIPMYQSLPEL